MSEVAEVLHAEPSLEARSVYTFKANTHSSHTTILRLAGRGQGRRLLDVGTADGFLAQRFAEQGWQVTGIERDPALASLARRYCSEVVVADLNEGVPDLDGVFDTIIFGDVLEHLIVPEEVFQSLVRRLANDGIIIVSVPNVAHLWVRLTLLLGQFDYADRGILDRTHLRFFTLKTFGQFLEACQVRVTTIVPVPAPLFLAIPQRYHRRWLSALHALNALGARWWPRGLAYQFVAIGRRR